MLLFVTLFPHKIQADEISLSFTDDNTSVENIVKQIKQQISIHNKNLPKTDTKKNLLYWNYQGKEFLTRLLNYYGFYYNNIDITLKNKSIIAISIKLGPIYKIDAVHINNLTNKLQKPIPQELIQELVGQNANTQNVLNNQSKIQQFISDNNCLLNVDIKHKAILDHKNHTLTIHYKVITGNIAYIKKFEIDGLKKVKKQYIENILSQNYQRCFTSKYLLQTKKKLLATNLFSSVKFDVPKKSDANNEVIVGIQFLEQKYNFLQLGLLYGTDKGVSGLTKWQINGLFGKGEQLISSLSLNKTEQNISVEYNQPFFLNTKKSFSAILDASRNSKEKKITNEYALTGLIKQTISEPVTIGYGIKYSVKIHKDNNEKSNTKYSFLSVPVYIQYNKKDDDKFFPTKGYMIKLSLEPFINQNNASANFLKSSLYGTKYIGLTKSQKTALAFKLKLKSITSDKFLTIPKFERLYIGGAQSIRGYGYDKIGDFAINKDDILGFQNTLELSTELRQKIHNKLSLAIFLDSGVTINKYNNIHKQTFCGAGLGVRYNTQFIPLRADIAFPITHRSHLKKGWQLYLGIGQSF